MTEPYAPPEMPPFPSDYDGVMRELVPYYQEQRPLEFFFEMYIIDVIDELPDDTIKALADFSIKHPSFFEAHCGDWRQIVVKESHLSDTIDVAIWDLWIRNSANAQDDGGNTILGIMLGISPRTFSQKAVALMSGRATLLKKRRNAWRRTATAPHNQYGFDFAWAG